MSIDHWKSLIGGAAALCSTVMLLPQLLRMRRSGARDVSSQMLYLYFAGVLLWLLYGVILHSVPLIVSNAAATGMVMACILAKWKSARKDCGRNSEPSSL